MRAVRWAMVSKEGGGRAVGRVGFTEEGGFWNLVSKYILKRTKLNVLFLIKFQHL